MLFLAAPLHALLVKALLPALARGHVFPAIFGAARIGSALASTAVAGMFIWASAQPTTAARGGL